MNMPLAILNRRRRGFTAFSPSALFALNEPGVWYDPSDLTTLFQDSAGTTPVTAPGDTVALMLDKSRGLVLGTELVTNTGGPFVTTDGWTAQADATLSINSGSLRVTNDVAATKRAYFAFTSVVGKSYVFTAAVSGAGGGVVGGRLAAGTTITNVGLGTTAAIASGSLRLQIVATGTTTYVQLVNQGTSLGGYAEWSSASLKELPGNHAMQATAASRPTYGVVPQGGRRNLLLATDTMATQSVTVTAVAHTLAFTGTGTVTLTGASIAGPLIGTGAGNRVSLTFTPTAGSLTMTVVGSVTLAQLETGSTATAYQRVTTHYDVTEAGVASLGYLFFDGSGDFMVTGTITPGTDKAQVFAGVRKLSDAAQGALVELSATIASNNGSFLMAAPDGATATFGFDSKGTSQVDAIASSLTAPISRIVTGLGDIAGDTATIRINGVQEDQDTGDQGTGNYLAYPIYIGRRGGTTLPFNGHLYSLITRFGPNLDAPTIASTEAYVAGKTGVVI